MRYLNGKVAVITGAGSGIGRSLSLLLAAEKVSLALIDINEKSLKETKNLIVRSNIDTKTELYVLDITNYNRVQQIASQIIDDFGTVDILLNNAGVTCNTNVCDANIEILYKIMNINLWGTVHLTKTLLPYLHSRKESSIVNISSIYGLIPMFGHSGYCMSKYAVRGFTEVLQLELLNSPITVTIVYPSGVRTNIVRNSIVDKKYEYEPDFVEKKIAEIEKSFKIPPERAAKQIIKGIKKKSAKVYIGKEVTLACILSKYFPFLLNYIARHYAHRILGNK